MAKNQPTGAEFVALVRSCLGRPYVFGADGPTSFDCSGLVYYNAHKLGIKAPRTSEEQFAWGDPVKGQPQAGDLVFFVGAEGEQPPGHVGVVVAPGRMIDAPHTGTVVQEASYGTNGGGVDEFMGYRRMPGIEGSKVTANQALITKVKSRSGNDTAEKVSEVIGFGMIIAAVLLVALLILLLIGAGIIFA